MIALADIMLAAFLLGPKPPWWKPIKRWKWRMGLAVIEQAAAQYEMQQKLAAVQAARQKANAVVDELEARRKVIWSAPIKQGRWDAALGRFVEVEDGEVN